MTAALRRIALDAITLDPELQPRAEINRAVLENYVQLLVAPPFLTEAAKAKLRQLASPEANAWSSALAALRLINEQVSVDELFEGRFVGFDHVVGPQLEAAHRWINELHGRFVNERHQRRRASRRVPLWGPGARE